MENDNKDREDLREIRRQLEEGDRETYVRRRPKAEPGVRIHGVYIPYLILRRVLLGVLAVILILLIAFFSGAFSGKGGGQAGTPSVAERTATASSPEESEPSAEELQQAERKAMEDAVLSEYENLAVVSTEGGYINLRSQPDSVDMTNIIGKLPYHAACELISQEGDWALVRSGGIQGYVSSQYLISGPEAEEIARNEISERAIIRADRLNMRSEPEIDPQNVVGKALAGERYELISQEGDWARIRVDNLEGVTEAYINIADDNAEIRECLDEARRLDLRQMVLAQFDNIVVSDDYLNIRESPDDGSIDNICGKFPSHAGGELLETTQSEDGRTWYKIKSGPVTGYVSADYCATGESARNLALEGATLTAMVNTDALNVRSEPSTEASVWTQIAKGQEYHVLDQLDGWVEIELDASDGTDEADRAYVSTRDNNVEVRYGLPEAIEYYPANGADCSGFVMKVLEHFGISVPRVSRDQARAGVRVTSANMKPGDLVFYANSSGTVNHVGMYIGNGQVVNAASRRSGIRIYAWNYRTPVAIRNVIGP